MIENIDYELTPGENEVWNVRMLKGDFIETVFTFGALKILEEELHFSYDLEYSPIDDLNEDNPELQIVVKDVLMSVLESALGNMEK